MGRLRPILSLGCALVAWGFPHEVEAADDLVLDFRPGEASSSSSPGYAAYLGAWEDWLYSPTRAVDAEGTPRRRSVVRLDGVDSFLRIDGLAPVDTDDGLTVEAWFRPGVLSGKQVIFSNTEYSGYTLRLEDDRLVGLVNIDGKYRKLVSNTRLEAGRDYGATFVVQLLGSGFEGASPSSGSPRARLILLLDGQFDAWGQYSISSDSRILNSPVRPLLGAEPDATGYAHRWYFSGLIGSVTVRNYPIDVGVRATVREAFFTVGCPGDGSSRGGRPAYTLDARFADGEAPPLDQLLAGAPPADVHIEGLVPFINDGYVVQGTAHSCEGGQLPCAHERIYLSLYHRGDSGELDLNHSLIAELDPDRGMRVSRCFRVGGRLSHSHVGGLAYYNGNLYMASSEQEHLIARFALPFRPLSDGNLRGCPLMQPEDEWQVQASSFVSFVRMPWGDPGLLVGEYCQREEECDSARAYMYALDSLGLVLKETPDFSFALPPGAQGAELTAAAGAYELVVSQSTSLSGYRLPPINCSVRDCTTPFDVPPEWTIETPAGGEDTFVLGDRVWTASESGSRWFNLREDGSWILRGDFFPFIYSMSPWK